MTALAASPLRPARCRPVLPGPRPAAPTSLAAASRLLRAGHRLPVPSGGGGGRSLCSWAPPPHAKPPSPEAAESPPPAPEARFPDLPWIPGDGGPKGCWSQGARLPAAWSPGVPRLPMHRFPGLGVSGVHSLGAPGHMSHFSPPTWAALSGLSCR